DVILDLMIHDIDMIIELVDSPVSKVDAVGTPVLGRRIDLANARINFESGCIANVTASRVSYKTERKMRVFARNHYLSCDLGEGRIAGYRLRGDPAVMGLAAIESETTRSRSRTALPTRSMPSSTASRRAPSRWSMAVPDAKPFAWRAVS